MSEETMNDGQFENNNIIESDSEGSEEIPVKTNDKDEVGKSRRILQFMDTITPSDQEKLDELFARSVFVNNISHRITDSPEFIAFVKRLRPSWDIPSAYKLSNRYFIHCFSISFIITLNSFLLTVFLQIAEL